nr:MAG TPA: Sigma 54 modulation/S30EA ribosomal protein C terminus [Caudoviricetes sp.]
MYLPKELFRNIENEKEVLEIISDLELDLKTDKSLNLEEAITRLEDLGEDLIIKEIKSN